MIFNCKCEDKTEGMNGFLNGETNQFQITQAVICCCNDKSDSEEKDNNEDSNNDNVECTYSVDVTVGIGGDFETLQQMYDWSNTISSFVIKVTLVSDLINNTGHVLIVGNGKRYTINGNGYTITQNASDAKYVIVVTNNSYLEIESITLENFSKDTDASCLVVSSISTCRLINNNFPITFINNNQVSSYAVLCQRNSRLLFAKQGNINIHNSKIGIYALYNSTITMPAGGAVNFNNVTTQFSPAKNTLSNGGSFINVL